MIPNCLVTLDYIKNSNTIFVPKIPSLKGEMVRRKSNTVVSNYINILKEILQLNKMVAVAADIMFVNGMAFLVSIYTHVTFTTVQYLVKSMTGNISKSLEKINGIYYRRGIYVETFYIDREFENIRTMMPGRLNLKMTATYEYVPEIKQHIRVIKECARSIWINLPFNTVSGWIFIETILFMMLCLTYFPSVGDISQIYYPRNIMVYCTLDYSKHCIV